MRYKTALFFIASFILLLVGYSIYIFISSSKKTAVINITIAPSGSVVKLNNKGIQSGVFKVRPGDYTIDASRQGFASKSIKISVKAKETRFAGIALEPNTEATKDWYKNHPQDQMLREAVGSNNFDQSGSDATTQNPLLKQLPYIGAGFSFRIDAGQSLRGSDQPAIYIRSISPQARANAIGWIKSMGYDPNKLEIVYSSEPPT